MKLNIMLSPNDPLWASLKKLGIESDEGSEYILTKKETEIRYLQAKRKEQTFFVPIEEIIYIESLGHDVQIHATDGLYITKERLKLLEKMLDPDRFLRVSNSCIISINEVRRIESSILQKFILHMSNGEKVDVTRSYYYIFRDKFNI